jgi:hypothetical protein
MSRIKGLRPLVRAEGVSLRMAALPYRICEIVPIMSSDAWITFELIS